MRRRWRTSELLSQTIDHRQASECNMNMNDHNGQVLIQKIRGQLRNNKEMLSLPIVEPNGSKGNTHTHNSTDTGTRTQARINNGAREGKRDGMHRKESLGEC